MSSITLCLLTLSRTSLFIARELWYCRACAALPCNTLFAPQEGRHQTSDHIYFSGSLQQLS